MRIRSRLCACACLWLIDNRSPVDPNRRRRADGGVCRRYNARVTSGKRRWRARLLFTIIINAAHSLARSLVSHFGDNASADTPMATIRPTMVDHNGWAWFTYTCPKGSARRALCRWCTWLDDWTGYFGIVRSRIGEPISCRACWRKIAASKINDFVNIIETWKARFAARNQKVKLWNPLGR